MVNSKINSNVNYSEIKEIDSHDDENISDIWVTKIKNDNVLVALGKLNYSNIKQNVFFINIYLIHDDELISKIGVYEFDNTDLPKIEENIQNEDLDIDTMGTPLLFSFVTNEFLDNYKYEEECEDEEVTYKNKEHED